MAIPRHYQDSRPAAWRMSWAWRALRLILLLLGFFLLGWAAAQG